MMRSGWNVVFALCFVPAVALADPQEAELNDVTLNADAATITGSIDVTGATSGTFQFRIRKVEVKNGELTLLGPLTASFGRSSQQLGTVAMRLSDGEGVCDMMALTSSRLPLARLGVEVDSQAVDLTVSASSTAGRVMANLLCSATHLLDEPGPLSSSVAALSALVNRTLGVTGNVSPQRPRLTNDSFTQPSNTIERRDVRARVKPARGASRLPTLAPVDEDEQPQLLEP